MIAEKEGQGVIPTEQGKKGGLKGAAPQHDAVYAAVVRNLDIVLRAGSQENNGTLRQNLGRPLKMQNTASPGDTVDFPKVVAVRLRPCIAGMANDEHVPAQREQVLFLDPIRQADFNNRKSQPVHKVFKLCIAHPMKRDIARRYGSLPKALFSSKGLDGLRKLQAPAGAAAV